MMRALGRETGIGREVEMTVTGKKEKVRNSIEAIAVYPVSICNNLGL